ncbi:MAG: hypothetical protein IPP71_14370 [Bacteroidetes bacterium]|nr:hypothetical protein [Bacteroidota bacterium]
MKKFTTLLFVLLISCGAFAQFNFVWNDTYSYTVTSGFSNEARKVAVDASGNVFVLSDITSDLDSTNHVGPTQYYVVLRKYTPAGVLLVQKFVNVKNMMVSGTFDFKSAFALEIDGSGSVFIGFNTFNSVGSNYDVQVMKYNNNLTSAWTFIYSTPANETGVNIVLRGTATFLLFKSVTGANTTYSIARVIPNTGTSVPLYSFDTNLDVVTNMVTTPTKNLFVTGYRLISGVKNVMTASVNTSGLLKWKSTYNNGTVSGDDVGNDILASIDGFLYVGGTTFTNATNGTDALILRYNSANGTRNSGLLINIPQGAVINETGYEVVDGPVGTIYFSATRGNRDVFVYKVSTSNGVVLNANASFKPNPASFTSISSLNIADMKVSASGKVYVCGGITGGSASGNFGASYLANFGPVSGAFSLLGNVATTGTSDDSYQGVGIALDPPRNVLIYLQSFWSTNLTHSNELILVDSYSMECFGPEH